MRLYNAILIANRDSFIHSHGSKQWKADLHKMDLDAAISQLTKHMTDSLSRLVEQAKNTNGEDRTKTDLRYLDADKHRNPPVSIKIDTFVPLAIDQFNDVLVFRVAWATLNATVTVRPHGWYDSGFKIDVFAHDFADDEWIKFADYKYKGPRDITIFMSDGMNLEYERPDAVATEIKWAQDKHREEHISFFKSMLNQDDMKIAH